MSFRFNPNPYGTNEVMNLTSNCFVSYNPSPFDGRRPEVVRSRLDEAMADILGPKLSLVFGSEGGCDETALNIDGEYLILNGDFREEYVQAANEDVALCLEVYKRNQEEHRSKWSSDAHDYEFMLKRLMGVVEDTDNEEN